MLTIQTIREDLKEIQYYYAKREIFDEASKMIGQSSILDKVNRYNQAIKDAPARLYDLYVSLYVRNNTQAAIAYDWDFSNSNIKYLNDKLCKYLLKVMS